MLEVSVSSAQVSINSSFVSNLEKVEADVLDELNIFNFVRVIIDVNSKNSIDSIVSQIPETELRFEREMMFRDAFVAEITSDGLKTMSNNPYILKVSLDRVVHTLLQQSLPLINATKVWAEGYTGKGQTVCVIDSGVNASHSDLSGKVLAEYCYCSLGEKTSSDCCPDGTSEDNNAEDNNGHGTYVTGIAGAKGKTINKLLKFDLLE